MSSVYPWQQPLWAQLSAYLEQGRIPQALLITGAAGVGKGRLAEVFARALLCHQPSAAQACGQCRGCKLMSAGTHPDFISVEPDEAGKAIGIDKIRQLIGKLALKPQYDAYRVVVISPADQLNTASANAFLKCLEEPTERTVIVLLTDKPSRLPATIRSRCQLLVCPQPDLEICSRWLRQQGIEQQQAGLLLHLAQGAPLLAKQFAEQGMLEARQACFQAWLQVGEGRQSLLAVAEQWQKPNQPELGLILSWMLSWVADIAKAGLSPDANHLQNQDVKNSLQALAQRLELKRVYQFYDELLQAQAQLATQINKQLLLEQLLIGWSQLNHR